jgi:hypothetical protein
MMLLAPYERLAWIILAVGLVIAGVVWVHHLEQVGVARQQAADAKVEAAQVVHVQEVEARAQQLVSSNNIQLVQALATPAVPGFTILCPSAPHFGNKLPANGGTVGGSAGSGGLPSRVGGTDAGAGVDLSPETYAILARANAKLSYWQHWYQDCKAEGACR